MSVAGQYDDLSVPQLRYAKQFFQERMSGWVRRLKLNQIVKYPFDGTDCQYIGSIK